MRSRWAAGLFMICAAGWSSETPSSMTGEQMKGYLEGAGMGLAKPAEMHSYPGPMHVLELAEGLGLTEEQRSAVEVVHRRMKERAMQLGRGVVDAERRLDRLFAGGEVSEAVLERTLAVIAGLQGDLRGVHLRAHIETRDLLTAEQVHEYDRLRGNAPSHPAEHHPGHGE
ncbi:MAG TPA: hypothetical protein VMS56_03290 [Thermoanaerobaculia bacterium]|nr:hypothetical protein [Thermoanaerobaculia bacterium]